VIIKKGIKSKTKPLVDTAGLKTITHKDAKQNFTSLSKQIYQIKIDTACFTLTFTPYNAVSIP